MPQSRIGQYFKKRPRRRRPRGLNKQQASTVRKIARKEVRGMCEKKVFGTLGENLQLYHNKTYYVPNLLKCKQGVEDPNDLTDGDARVGDEILIKNVNIRLWLSNKLDRPNVMYKCYLFWYESGATLSDTLCYFTQQNKMLDRINNEKISIIDKQTIFSGASYENGTEKHEHSKLCTLNGNWKGHKITYDEGGGTPKKRDIGMMVVCYDAYGTLQTDNIASFAFNHNVKFIDP